MPAFSNITNLTFVHSTVNVVAGSQITSTGDSPSECAQSPSDKNSLPRLTRVFTGRKDILDKMTGWFNQTETSLLVQKLRIFVLYGLGGGGKTQLMLKFVENARNQFSDIYFIDASTQATIRSGLEDIARKARVGETVDLALGWLSGERKEWLLLFDNADDTQINLNTFFPNCKHGNIIVTTRNNECRLLASGPDSCYCVSGMAPEDAIELLLRQAMVERSHENRRLCAEIVHELGYLALAISQAGAYIAKFSCLTDYLRIYLEDRAELWRRHSVQTTDDYQWTVYTTWETSLKKLTPTAARFLRICSFLHYDGISKRIFREAGSANGADGLFQDAVHFLRNFQSDSGQWSDVRFHDLANELTSYSLINVNAPGDLYSIHPLVHAWARNRIDSNEKRETQACAMQILALAITNDHSADSFAFRRTLLSHVDEIRSEVKESDIIIRLQRIYTEAGRWKEAEELQKLAMGNFTDELGDDHPSSLEAMLDLGMTYSQQGRWLEAQKHMEHVMAVRTNVLGEEHSDTLTIKRNLGSLYSHQGRYREAEALQVKTMDASKKILGEEHPDTLTVMSDLAWTYGLLQRSKDAEVLLRKVVEARKRSLGDEHPDTLTTMTRFAAICAELGRWTEAEAVEEKVLETRSRVLGAAHPETLRTMAGLAVTYDFKGHWKKSEELLVKVLAARRKLLGDERPDTLYAMSNLAWSYTEQGRWEEAEALQVRAMECMKRDLGDDHLAALWYRSNLGWTWSHRGRWDAAEELHLELRARTEKLLGENHTTTLRNKRFLGWCYSQQGRLEEAEALQTSVVKTSKTVLGEENSDTLGSMSHLANTYSRQGRWREAETLESKVVHARRRIIGVDHPHTLTSISALSEYRRLQMQEVHGPIH